MIEVTGTDKDGDLSPGPAKLHSLNLINMDTNDHTVILSDKATKIFSVTVLKQGVNSLMLGGLMFNNKIVVSGITGQNMYVIASFEAEDVSPGTVPPKVVPNKKASTFNTPFDVDIEDMSKEFGILPKNPVVDFGVADINVLKAKRIHLGLIRAKIKINAGASPGKRDIEIQDKYGNSIITIDKGFEVTP